MMMVIQCFAPSHLPTAAEGGCSSTKVTKNSETARLRSSGVAPMSLVKPVSRVMKGCDQHGRDLTYLESPHCRHWIDLVRSGDRVVTEMVGEQCPSFCLPV